MKMKKIKLNNKIFSKYKRGFTLVEVIVSVGIFVIVVAGSSGIFASAFKTYKNARNVDENLKNAQFAMNLMSKTFRTSSLKFPTGTNQSRTTIVVYDYSQSSCIRFRFSGGNLLKSTAAVTEPNCDSGSSFGTEYSMTSGAVYGRFYTTDSSGDDTAKTSERVGKISIMINITSGSGSSSSNAIIQSTSSLRDYNVSNVGLDLINNPN